MEFYDRELRILRQSQTKIALDFLIEHGITPTMKELYRVTDVFVETCLRPSDDDLKARIKELDKWIVEKKKEKNE